MNGHCFSYPGRSYSCGQPSSSPSSNVAQSRFVIVTESYLVRRIREHFFLTSPHHRPSHSITLTTFFSITMIFVAVSKYLVIAPNKTQKQQRPFCSSLLLHVLDSSFLSIISDGVIDDTEETNSGDPLVSKRTAIT